MKPLAMTCLFFGATLVAGGRCGADEPAPGDPVSDGNPLSAWVKALKAPDYPTRARAAEAIGRLGARAKAAEPALREAMSARGGPVPVEAGAALWKVDRAAFTKILSAEGRTHARYVAVLSLPTIGADAKELLPLVLKIAADKRDAPNRQHALLALGFIGASPADVVPVLTAALQEERGQYTRMEAAQALGQLGPKAKDALPSYTKRWTTPTRRSGWTRPTPCGRSSGVPEAWCRC